MVKKIIIFTLILLVLVTPVVYGDAGPAPKSVDGKIIDIKVRSLLDEIAIGEQATLEVTVTNLTREQVRLIRMYFGIFSFSIDHTPELLSIDTDELSLGAYESVTFEITDEIFSYIDWYKIEDQYYTDIETVIKFFSGGNDDDDYYYQEGDAAIPIKISNLYDGSEYVEIEWLDNIDTIYYHEYLVEQYHDDGRDEMLSRANIYFEMNFMNNSKVKVYNVEPHSEKITYDSYTDYTIRSKVNDSFELNIRPIFYMDDKYYCVEVSRMYDIQFLEAPDVSVEISSTESDDEVLTTKYIVTVQNTGEETIHNFMVMADNCYEVYNHLDYEKIIDLKEGDSVSLECYYLEEDELQKILVGYLLDGMFYNWDFDVSIAVDDVGTVTISTEYDNMYMGYRDYDYRKCMTEENVALEAKSMPSATHYVTTSSIQDTTPPIKQTTIPTITIQKRYYPMVWSFIANGALMVGAIITIILSLRNIIKHNESNKT